MLQLRSQGKIAAQTILGMIGLLGVAEHLGRSLRGRITPTGHSIVERYKRMKLLYSQFIHPGDLIFDIGANLGTREETALALGAKRIIAVEPQENCVRYLRLRYGRDPRVIIVPKGVAAASGIQTLYLSPTTGASTFSATMREAHKQIGIQYAREMQAELTTLDALIAEYGVPNFTKIDVEGFEQEVLKGLSQPLPLLSFEAQSSNINAAVTCIECLEALGTYQYNFIVEEQYALGFQDWLDADGVMAFVRNDLGATPQFGDIFARHVPSVGP